MLTMAWTDTTFVHIVFIKMLWYKLEESDFDYGDQISFN